MISNITLKESAIQGIGMFALHDIHKGYPILKIDDSRLVTAENPLRESEGEYERHCDYLTGGKVVLMQSPERHINHSCSPNTFVKTIHGVRYVFALSDIASGEEITYDYCINGSGDTLWQCSCGSPRCRKEIPSVFFPLPRELQLEYLTLLDDWYLEEYQVQVEALLRSAGMMYQEFQLLPPSRMTPSPNSPLNQKSLVHQGYDRCAAAYAAARQQEAVPQLSLLTSRLASTAHVLDIGCGAGVPVARALSERFTVTGVDISGAMINLARQHVPHATFIESDVMALDFPPASFDAIVSFYAIFHIPREEHPELFRRIHRWLKPGGYLLASLAFHDEPLYTENDFFGAQMFWSNYDLDTYLRLLQSLGFQLLETARLGHGFDDKLDFDLESHPLVLVQK